MHFEYDDLAESASNFDDRPISKGGNKLGEGGFGPVFKGILRCTDVAIKRLKPKDKTKYHAFVGKEQFVTEIEVLAQFRHPNLISLMGYSCNGKYPCLVYEFMENGTLEDKLDPRERSKLPWETRVSIMLDSARGILYLHTANPRKPFIHRDIKSANILLDLAMSAKVGDFGLVRSLRGGEESEKTRNVMGTSGYLAPEYLRGEITPKLDVFSFGVIMLEVLTGLAPHDPRRKDRKDLISYLEAKLENPKSLIKYFDRMLGTSYPEDQALEFAYIAADCVEYKVTKRCDMKTVYSRLEKLPLVGIEKGRQEIDRVIQEYRVTSANASCLPKVGQLTFKSPVSAGVIPRGAHVLPDSVFNDGTLQDSHPHDKYSFN
eukprot:m.309441 g.309441  ORF g.309441 m.309441 type:complete len:375 (+) comp46507_c0_seq1:198-1322(+)